jgi:hypothetical protein
MNSTLNQKITPTKLKCLNTLISKRGIDKETKAMMVAGFSDGRCESSKELYDDEAVAMIKHLQSLQPHQAEAEKMRNKILYYAHEMNWRNHKLKVDIQRVDAWCKKFGYLHKALDQYEYNELPKLVTQFENVYKHYLHNL